MQWNNAAINALIDIRQRDRRTLIGLLEGMSMDAEVMIAILLDYTQCGTALRLLQDAEED